MGEFEAMHDPQGQRHRKVNHMALETTNFDAVLEKLKDYGISWGKDQIVLVKVPGEDVVMRQLFLPVQMVTTWRYANVTNLTILSMEQKRRLNAASAASAMERAKSQNGIGGGCAATNATAVREPESRRMSKPRVLSYRSSD